MGERAVEIQERYLQDISKCLDVYKSLYNMQTDDKIQAFNYISNFYDKAKTEQGKKQIVDNAECYRRVMCNIHLFRWLEIERNVAKPEIVKQLQQNSLWQRSTKELAEEAIGIFKTLNITPSSNGYSLNSDVLKNYISMSQIETQAVEDSFDDLDDFDIDLVNSSEDGIQFDEFSKSDIGFQNQDGDFDSLDDLDLQDLDETDTEEDPGEPEDYSDIDITDEDLGITDEDLKDTQSVEESKKPETDVDSAESDKVPESTSEDIQSERKRINDAREAESNRVEIPLDVNVNSDIETVFGDYVQNMHVNSVMKTFRELYESCFSGIQSPDGILTPNGVLNFEQLKGDTKKQWHFNHQTSKVQNKTQVYRNYMNIVLYALGVLNGAQSCSGKQQSLDIARAKEQAVDAGLSYFGQAIGNTNQESGRFPSLQSLDLSIAENKSFYYPFMHEAFMTGYYALCSGLKKEAEEKKYVHNTVKVTSYDDLSKWISSKIKNCLLKAIEDSGIGVNGQTLKADYICNIMLNAIKNVVIIQDKQKGYITIKLCQNKMKFEPKQLEDLMNEYLSSSSGATQGLRAVVKSVQNDVATVDIVENEKIYSQSSLMASQVIDSIVESGQIPSWKNAIIGKGDKGIVRYDFTKADKCQVQIYGASGSGKGIMTSALVQNALIDNCNVFYFDGKPDNGAALAKIAWDRDKEAAVFNGLQGGSNTFPGKLEQFSHGIRNEQQLYNIESVIPDFERQPLSDKINIAWPFSSGGGGIERDESDLDRQSEDSQKNKWVQGAELRKLLIDVSRTLKAFEFVSDMVTIRQNLRDEGLDHSKDFCVFVIDEIQDAARNEMLIRKAMDNYMSKVEGIDIYKSEQKVTKNGVEVVQKRDGKVKDIKNWDKDPGYLFCKKWISWANDVAATNWQTLVTKQLRNSRCTIITIFQQNKWFTQDEKGIGHAGAPKSSRIGHMMLELSQKTVRIVGKGGIAGGTNSWGDLDEKKYSWCDEVKSGKWAIATGEGSIQNDAIIVRPFKVFTTDLGDGVRCQFDDRFNGADKCRTSRYDEVSESGETKQDPNGLDSYTHYMFNNMHDELVQRRDSGLTPEDVLEKSYKYFDEALKKNGMANGILDYFYNIPDMVDAVKTASEEDEYSKLGLVGNSSQCNFDTVDSNGNVTKGDDSRGYSLTDSSESDDFLESLNSGSGFDLDSDSGESSEPQRTQETQRPQEPQRTQQSGFDSQFGGFGNSQGTSDWLDEDLDLDGDLDLDLDDSTDEFEQQDFYNQGESQESQEQAQTEFWTEPQQTVGNNQSSQQNSDEIDESQRNWGFNPEPARQRPQKIVRNDRVARQTGTPQQDSDGFDTFISDYQVNSQSQGESSSRYSEAQLDSLEDILYDNSLDNLTKLQLMGDIIRRNNVRVNEVDCVPLESQMMQETIRTDPRSGVNVFSDGQQNRPHVLGSSTIQAQPRQVQRIRNNQAETDKSLQDRFDVVLDVISQTIPESTVIRLMMTNNTVQVNGRNLYLGNIINNNIQMPDIFNLHKTFSRFGNLKMLLVDMQIFGEIQGELGELNPIPKVFMMCPSLENLVLLGQNRQIQFIDRASCNDLDEQTLRMIKSQDYQDKIDVVSAQYLQEDDYNKQPVYIRRRIEKTQTRMNSRSFGRKNRRFTSNQVQRSGMATIRRQQSENGGQVIRRQVSGAVSGFSKLMEGFNRKQSK